MQIIHADNPPSIPDYAQVTAIIIRLQSKGVEPELALLAGLKALGPRAQRSNKIKIKKPPLETPMTQNNQRSYYYR